ncbi:DNA polymerase-3 subunit gamma/tau [Catalinimonas alkaloidigena]|uniref:DNA polymerase III subunit gamma/tau n=1 Tax=Catalinimonas alkaloidigena TaxID=1075417 RepID=A0A1G9LKJ4_9BACT|nr:DNA polymerase III subunit gamma/tau [Catalinimonas alkaloidigena]SDL62403.1 DNA polymerase-3 subunit gamma/tau [Catalinimonas alkaloidigena]
MDQFVVSARKYRPGTFDTVVGQQHVTTTLKNAIAQQHLAQAFLFCGPRGVGKTTCARILAKTINCENLTEHGEACNQCSSCTSFNNSSSFNVHELDAASNNSVEDIRNLVEQVRYAPQVGRYKVYIIDEVHMLSNAAFNAFLKTLEEPPSYAIFILATTEKHKIIPTILSRCQIFDFNRIQVRDIANHLASIARQEDIPAESEALRLIGQKADGGLRDALSMFDLISTFSPDRSITYRQVVDNLHILDYDYYFRVTEAALLGQMSDALLLFDEVLRKGFDGHQFVVGLAEHLRNLLVCKDEQTLSLLEVSEEVQDRYRQQARAASASFLMTALHLTSQCDQDYKNSKNQRLHVEIVLMKLCHVQSAVNLVKFEREAPSAPHDTPSAPAAQPTPEARPSAHGNNGIAPAGAATPATPIPPANGTAAIPPKPVATPPPSGGQGTSAPPKPTIPAIPRPTVGEPAATAQPAEVASAAPTPTKTTAPPPRPSMARSTVRLPDLNALRTQVSHPAATTAAPVQEAATALAEAPKPIVQDEPVVPDTLMQVFTKHVERLKEENPNYYALSGRPLTVKGTCLHLKLDHKFQSDTLEQLRPELLEYLRQTLRNRQITIQSEIAAPQEVRKQAYTPSERFTEWAQENPLLKEFRQRFNLEIDY